MENNLGVSLKNSLTNLVNSLEKTDKDINNFRILNVPIEDWYDIFENSSNVLGGLYKIYNFAKLYTFKKFLKGISGQINIDNPLSPKDKQKLDNYLSKESNINFIYNTIRKSLTANSLKCTELLAVIVGKLLREQIEMTQENITLINALHILTDYDLDNFYKIYIVISGENLRKIRLDKLYNSISKNTIDISVRKFVNLQLLFQDTITIHQGLRFGGDEENPANTIMNDDEKFIILNNISDLFFKLLEKTKGKISFLE